MADISFYKYLEAAFRYRLFNPEGQRATLKTPYPYLGYNLEYQRIFYYARRVLPKFYRNAFPDTEEGNLQMAKTVLEKLDKHQDLELGRYFNPSTAPLGNEQIIQQAKAESGVVPAQKEAVAAGSLAGVAPMGGISGPPSIPRFPEVPSASTTVPSIPSSFEANEPVKTAIPKGVMPEPVISAVKQASSSSSIGIKKFSTRLSSGLSGILGGVAGGGGRVLGGVGSGLDGLTRFSNRLSPVPRGLSGLSNRQPLIKMPPKKLWFLILGLFLGVGLLTTLFQPPTPGEAGSIGSGCPNTSTNKISCHYLNPSIDLFNTTLSPSAINSYISRYSLIFINDGKGDLAEFTKRVNYIVTSSQQAGLNPAIFLGYWKSESGFSTLGSRDMGCVGDNFYEQVDCALGINKFSDPVKNPIPNCARSKDANSAACTALKSIRKTYDLTHPVKYPIATFDDFAESYGPYDDLTNGIPTNCTATYNTLIDVAEQLNACVAAPTLAGNIVPIGEGGAKIASVAQQIAEQLVHSTRPGMAGCNPVGTYGPSYHCWSEMAIYDQANDPDYLQCTEFVWAVFDKAGYGSQINEVRGGNAADWPNLARKSQSFIVFNDPNQLQPGDIISLGQGGLVSHVAVVVNKEGNRVRVAQASTSAPLEVNYIQGNEIIVPNAGIARIGTIGFIRLKNINQ